MMLIPLLILAAAIFGFPAYLAYLRAQGDPVKTAFANELEISMQNAVDRIVDLGRDSFDGTRRAWNATMPPIFRQFGWLMVWVIAIAGGTGFIYGCWTGHWGKSLGFILVPTLVSVFWMWRVTRRMVAPPPAAAGAPVLARPWFNPSPMLNSTLTLLTGLGGLWVVVGLWIHWSHILGWESNGRPIAWIGATLLVMASRILRVVIRIIMILAAKGVAFTEAVPNKLLQAVVAVAKLDPAALGAVTAPGHAGPVDIAKEEEFVKRGEVFCDMIDLGLFTILAFTLNVMSFGGLFVILFVALLSYLVLDLIRIRAKDDDKEQKKLAALKLRSAKFFSVLNYALAALIVLPIFFPGLEQALDNFGVTLNFFMLSLVAGGIHTLNWLVEFARGDRSIPIRNDNWKGALWGFLGFGAFFALLFPWKEKAVLRRPRMTLAIPTGGLALVFAFSFILTMVAKSSESHADGISVKGFAVVKMPEPRVRVSDTCKPGWDFSWDGVPNAIGYRLERRPEGNKVWDPVQGADWLTAGVLHWSDCLVVPGDRYYYRLTALYNGRESEPSDEYFMTVPVPPPAPSTSPDAGTAPAPTGHTHGGGPLPPIPDVDTSGLDEVLGRDGGTS